MEQTQEPQGVLYAVYGTLRQGFGNNRLLQNEHSQYLGTQTLEAPFRMVAMGGFPGMIYTGADTPWNRITIEVFRVSNPGVEKRLDMLEGYPGWYDKQTIETEWGTAFIYTQTEAQVGKNPPVESGDWKQYINNSK